MSRLSRRKQSCETVCERSVFDLFDNQMKLLCRANNSQYDKMLEQISDQELDVLLTTDRTIAHARNVITILNKYIP